MTVESYYLPYSVGCIWSFVNGYSDIRENYCLDHIIWKRDPVEDTARKLSKSNIVGFSSYVWNNNWNNAVAKRVKELNPECVIVYGGPEPAINDPDMFAQIPWVDAVIKREGEQVFLDLLRNLNDLTRVPGLKLNNNGISIDTGEAARITDLESLPSPYLTGVFDDIIDENPNIEWAATLETNRGCPYGCTFCDWGSLTYSKVTKFSLQRVLDEITWFGEKKIAFLSIADANFGMFVERDNQIVDHFIAVQNKYGFPYAYTASYAKNQRKDVLGIIEKLVHNSKQKNAGLLVSLQTLSEEVLGNIKRKNLKINDCEVIFREAEKRMVPVGTELILGLPGETLESWRKGFWKLLNMNLHTGIDIYTCQLLENAEINQVQKEIYNITSKNNYDYFVSFKDDIKETIKVVESTSSLPKQDMLLAQEFNWEMQTLHLGGLSNFYSRFLVKQEQTTYEKFYNDLCADLNKNSLWQQERLEFQYLYTTWINNGLIDNYQICGTPISGRNMHYCTQIKVHAQPHFKQQLVDLITMHVRNNYAVDSALFNDLQKLQDCYIVDFWNQGTYPKNVEFGYNVYQYIIDSCALKQHPNTLLFEFQNNKILTESEFADYLFIRRRNNSGKAWITTI